MDWSIGPGRVGVDHSISPSLSRSSAVSWPSSVLTTNKLAGPGWWVAGPGRGGHSDSSIWSGLVRGGGAAVLGRTVGPSYSWHPTTPSSTSTTTTTSRISSGGGRMQLPEFTCGYWVKMEAQVK